MLLPRIPRAVIFDMDGTILNTEFLYHRALVAAGRETGVPIAPSLSLGTVGLSWESTTDLLLQHFQDGQLVEALLGAWLRQFDLLAESELSLKPGVAELLDQLDMLGIPSAIATSSDHSDVERHLTALGVGKRFATIVASGDYDKPKPAPDPFLVAAERLLVEPLTCVALEDSIAGITAASCAGMMTVMIPDLSEPTDEHRAHCLYVARDLCEVIDVIARSLVPSEASDPHGRPTPLPTS